METGRLSIKRVDGLRPPEKSNYGENMKKGLEESPIILE